MVNSLPYNPFPSAFKVYPKQAEQIDTISRQLNSAGLDGIERICPTPPGSKAAKTAEGESCDRISHRVLSVANYLWIVVLIAFIVLMVSSTLLVANTIRLSIFARRREIEVMKLVGATNWFVRGPFMLEGLICGLVGSVVAVFLLLLGKEIALPQVLGHIDDGDDVQAISFALNALIVIGIGLLLGAAGSALTIRRFLKV